MSVIICGFDIQRRENDQRIKGKGCKIAGGGASSQGGSEPAVFDEAGKQIFTAKLYAGGRKSFRERNGFKRHGRLGGSQLSAERAFSGPLAVGSRNAVSGIGRPGTEGQDGDDSGGAGTVPAGQRRRVGVSHSGKISVLDRKRKKYLGAAVQCS